MPNWKKVVVSGSNAHLNTVTASYFSGDGSALSGVGGQVVAKDEGSTISAAMSSIDFVGSGVAATESSNAVTVTISGADLDAVFEEDSNEDLMPTTSTQGLSVHYEYDSSDDIMPRV